MLLLVAALAGAVAPLRPRDLVEVVDLSGLTASPDGRWVAWRIERPSVAHNRIALSWAVLPVDSGGPVRVIADGGIGLANGAGVLAEEQPVWSADSRSIVYRARTGGVTGLWRAAVDGDQAERLSRPSDDVVSYRVADAGRKSVLALGPERATVLARETQIRASGEHLDGSVDLSIGVIGGSDPGDGTTSIRMTGDWFARRPLVDALREQSLDLSVPLTPAADPPGPTAAEAAAVRHSVCRIAACAAGSVTSIVKIPSGATWLATYTSRGRDQSLYRVGAGGAQRLAGGAGLLSGGRSETAPCAVTATAAFCVSARAGVPPRLVRIDLAEGGLRPVFEPNAMLASRLVATTQSLVWRDRQGRRFTGVLLAPARAYGPLPLVIQYYWCSGFLRGGEGDELPYQLLVQQRIAGLCINRTAATTQQDAQADYDVALSGIGAIIARLAANGTIDRRRVGMQGLSFGSEVTMAVLRRSRLLRAASIASGQVEPSFLWYGSLPGRDLPRRLGDVFGLGDPDTSSGRWRLISPAKTSAAIRAPLLMQLPETEARWSIELIARLARGGHLVDTYVFPEAAHVKFLPQQKEAAYARNLGWFSFWLSAERLGSPDAAAFARWRSQITATPFR